MNKSEIHTICLVTGIAVGIALAFVAVGCGGGASDPSPNGEACEVDDDCENEVCLLELGDGAIEFPDGLCSAECEIFTGEGCVEDEEICLIYRPTGQSNCYQLCESDGECREGYVCLGINRTDKACLPPL